MFQRLWSNMKESFVSTLPIVGMVLLLNLTIAPASWQMIVTFLVGSLLLILGMSLFTMGADLSMMPMGEKVGGRITKSKKVWQFVVVSFVFGFMVTIAEPDLQVLASQVPAIPTFGLILTVAAGAGLFLVVAMLRILFQIPLYKMLIVMYGLVFVMAFFASDAFLPVAFDSGGVTTGPMTVPFIMALGFGAAAVRGDKSTQDDSFGLIGLCSIGPVLAVLVLGLFYGVKGGNYQPEPFMIGDTLGGIATLFMHNIPESFRDVALAMAPILIFFLIFQYFTMKLSMRFLLRIFVGLIYTFLGIMIFLTGVNIGFIPMGNLLGQTLAGLSYHWILIPLGIVMGVVVVLAEPAVHVLTHQVEELTNGKITKTVMLVGLCAGVGASVAMSLFRVLTGMSIWYFLLIGYIIALLLTFFTPKVFTAIAFDSGGIAAGTMSATFLLPLAMGACEILGGDIMEDAFGTIAMVAMTPLITIQLLGVVYTLGEQRIQRRLAKASAIPTSDEDDDETIEFDEDAILLSDIPIEPSVPAAASDVPSAETITQKESAPIEAEVMTENSDTPEAMPASEPSLEEPPVSEDVLKNMLKEQDAPEVALIPKEPTLSKDTADDTDASTDFQSSTPDSEPVIEMKFTLPEALEPSEPEDSSSSETQELLLSPEAIPIASKLPDQAIDHMPPEEDSDERL